MQHPFSAIFYDLKLRYFELAFQFHECCIFSICSIGLQRTFLHFAVFLFGRIFRLACSCIPYADDCIICTIRIYCNILRNLKIKGQNLGICLFSDYPCRLFIIIIIYTSGIQTVFRIEIITCIFAQIKITILSLVVLYHDIKLFGRSNRSPIRGFHIPGSLIIPVFLILFYMYVFYFIRPLKTTVLILRISYIVTI